MIVMPHVCTMRLLGESQARNNNLPVGILQSTGMMRLVEKGWRLTIGE